MSNRILLIAIYLILSLSSYANNGSEWISQIKKSKNIDSIDVSEAYLKKDLKQLWTKRKSQFILGYIGSNFQRLRISFDSVKKIENRKYQIVGKSRVFTEACSFMGNLELNNVYKFNSIKDDCENSIRPTDYGVIVGSYSLKEDNTCHSAGNYEGIFTTYFYVENGEIKYDTLAECSDMFHNNSFIGTWESEKEKVKKACNWGDRRIPFSKELDNGAGEFFPVEKYWGNGWKHFVELRKSRKRASLDTIELDNEP